MTANARNRMLRRTAQRNEQAQAAVESAGEGSTWAYERFLMSKAARMARIPHDDAQAAIIRRAFGG